MAVTDYTDVETPDIDLRQLADTWLSEARIQRRAAANHRDDNDRGMWSQNAIAYADTMAMVAHRVHRGDSRADIAADLLGALAAIGHIRADLDRYPTARARQARRESDHTVLEPVPDSAGTVMESWLVRMWRRRGQ